MTTEATWWRPAEPSALTWRKWEDEVIVYNEATGDTHHLNPLASKLWLTLLSHPGGLRVEAVFHLVAAEVSEKETEPQILRALTDLAQLELVISSTA